MIRGLPSEIAGTSRDKPGDDALGLFPLRSAPKTVPQIWY